MKKRTNAQFKKLLDKIYSEYVRKKDAKNGYVRCYTCDKRLHWKEAHCGHYIPRNNLSTRFDERNTKPQCVGCNIFGNGKPDIFALRLEKDYGNGILQELHRTKQQVIRYFPYDEMIERYQSLLKKLSTP